MATSRGAVRERQFRVCLGEVLQEKFVEGVQEQYSGCLIAGFELLEPNTPALGF